MTESVIDFPKDSLCPQIWEKVVDSSGINEVWQLKPDVRAVLQDIFEKIVETTKQHFNIIHITGSITSNSYTENADIDMHFLSDQYEEDEARAEELNKMIRVAYKKTFIGKHPIEVYFQPNKFQDLMSVGCYDFFSNKWLVGPDLTDPSFNPYSEYYQEIQAKSEGLAQQIRNMIFSIYEISVVMKKNIATDFGNNIRAVLVSKLYDAQQMYDNIRQMRKVYSSPTSEEQALEYRSSRKWKVADGAFKLFDKYGYMAILKQFIEDYKLIQNSHEVDIEVVEDILGTIKNYINNADKLAEKELFEDEQIDEGTASSLLIAALLAIPGILPKDSLATELSRVPKNQMHMKSAPVQTAIDKATVDNTMIGQFSYRNSVNILQWVYYTEAANQSLEGRKAIFSIVWNRAGGKPENLVPIVLKSNVNRKGKRIWQFSEWKPGNNWNLVPPNSDKDWTYRVPSDITNPKVQQIWKEAEQFAKQMLAGKWKSNIGKCNLIASDKDSEIAKNTWGKDCTAQIGDHRFGYDPYQDGFRTKNAKAASNTYVVKQGDTLWKIAKAYNTTVDVLAKKNKIKANGVLKIGQKIIV